MDEVNGAKIVVTDMDRQQAISTFPSVFAMTKLRMIFKRHLKNIREAMRQRKEARASGRSVASSPGIPKKVAITTKKRK